MVSGAIGGFLDAAFNFNTQAFLEDNLLGQNLSVPSYYSAWSTNIYPTFSVELKLLISCIYHIALMHTYADQLHMIGHKLVMLGDETWIKLFPTLFARQDGVSSFYVSPFNFQASHVFLAIEREGGISL